MASRVKARNPVVLILLSSILLFVYVLYATFFEKSVTMAYTNQHGHAVVKATSPLPFAKYTLQTLIPFNGFDRPYILVAVGRKVYDVTSSASYYGPGGDYSAIAGRDSSRALAIGKLPTNLLRNVPQPWDDLQFDNHAVKDTFNYWCDFFASKYPCVGTLVQTLD